MPVRPTTTRIAATAAAIALALVAAPAFASRQSDSGAQAPVASHAAAASSTPVVSSAPVASSVPIASNTPLQKWDARAVYNVGDRVKHEGRTYQALTQYQGHGDAGWINAPSLWRQLEADAAPISADILSRGSLTAPLSITRAPADQVVFATITIQPGASTGLHCHYGQLIATVRSGELTHHAPNYPTGVRVYKAGEALGEGSGYVHYGENLGSTPLVLDVLYLITPGKPLSQSDLAKCDPR